MELQDELEIKALRSCMESFLNKRCEEKLAEKQKKGVNDTVLANVRQHFCLETWLAEASRRASRIRLVTHALKYIHPHARGSSLYVDHAKIPDGYVGTTSCSTIFGDVVGDAACLDVYSFLKLELDGKTILRRVWDRDASLLAAFSEDRTQAKEWMESFRKVLAKEDSEQPKSHTLAKQIYFPLEQGGYHLLAPLFPTSLVHYVYLTIRDDKKKAKEAWEAQKDGSKCVHGYRDYPHLLVQKFGGKNPQNISQLNSQRNGESWLLASFPPTWVERDVRLPLETKSVFGTFLDTQLSISKARKHLISFLERTQGENTNIRIREKRATLVDELLTAVVQCIARIRAEPPGWSADERCILPEDERFWLDPRRGEIDANWQELRSNEQWLDNLLNKAALWFNRKLTTKNLAMGDEEYNFWKKQLAVALRQLEEGEMTWNSTR